MTNRTLWPPSPTHWRILSAVLAAIGLALAWYGFTPVVIPAPQPEPPIVWVLTPQGMHPVRGGDAIPANLLLAAGVHLFPGDRVRCDGLPCAPEHPAPLAWHEGSVLQVQPATPIKVHLGPYEKVAYSAAPTVGQAVWEAGVRWGLADRLAPGPETPRTSASTVRRIPARTVTVRTPEGEEILIRTTAETVGEALAQGGIALQGLDTSDPPADAPLPEDGVIQIHRVREEIVLEQRPLPFETRYQPLPEVEIDQLQVVQPGEYGLEVRRVRVRYVDGEESARTVEDTWIARPPQDRIVGYGTKIVIRTLDTPDGPIRYWRAVQVYATSYSPCRLGVDYCDHITSSGKPLHKGIVAVTLAWYRSMKGMLVYIPGYGIGEIADVGGGIPGRHWIDLGYSDDDYVPWHQWVTVYFLAPPPPAENILWILP